MNSKPELIVMLTKDDVTLNNAYEIFESCKNSKAKYWGFKEIGLPIDKMKELFSYMKKMGKTTFLEVVEYDEKKGLEGALVAKECGCDYLLGTKFYDSINDFCKENNIKYMPFVGNVKGRPSILYGEIEDMIKEAQECIKKGAYGIDLLGYRYVGNSFELNRRMVLEVNAPICIAGSVDSIDKLKEIIESNPTFFTIGSAFFENKFGKTINEQINIVCEKMKLFKKESLKRHRPLFCDMNPIFYEISDNKEKLKRHIKNFTSKETFSITKQDEKLKYEIYTHKTNMIKRAPGVDITLQKNKAINIDIASKKINGVLIKPGETFSLWKLVGNPSVRKGYKRGRIIKSNILVSGTGGGLCNLGNSIHLAIIHSPLEVTELHLHSDALAPDEGKRIPFSAGTSVSYNTLDFRFKNNTDQIFQLLTWCEGEESFVQLRSEKNIPYTYEIIEEGHHFAKEGKKYYRLSKIYKITKDKKGKIISKELILDNHSEVMYDYSLIPKELIK